jgi:hypothetical protein
MERPTCSAKGCREPARYAVLWNNPAVHTPDREKAWHACEAHVQHLSEFVSRRGFLLRVEPLPVALLPERDLLPEAAQEPPEHPTLPG